MSSRPVHCCAANGLLLAVVILLLLSQAARAQMMPLQDLDKQELQARVAHDMAAVRKYRDGLQSVLSYVRSDADIFPAQKLREPRLLKEAQKEAVLSTWKSALDYMLALDSTGQYHQKYYRLKGKEQKRDSFAVFYAVFLARYSFALEFIARVENDAGLGVLLNEPVPELGMPKETYAKFKFRFLNVGRATEFVALNTINKVLGKSDGTTILSAGIEADKKVIWKAGRGKGPLLTLKNAGAVVKSAGFAAWFPVQAGVSEWMGDTKVRRKKQNLISQAQIRTIMAQLEPGDILLERREWYLSNIGLPGFWPHAALYVGTPEERARFFADGEVAAWVREQGVADGNLETLLGSLYPKVSALSRERLEDGHLPRVIEALSEGVLFTSLEHSAAADSLAVLRPRVSKQEKAFAIARAFKYHGRPYDFNFDFQTDATLVCTELIYRSYEGMLHFPLKRVMGRDTLPAIELVRKFTLERARSDRELDFVLFLDAVPAAGQAKFADEQEFCNSADRPRSFNE